MKFNIYRPWVLRKLDELEDWHLWFAWYPVMIDVNGDCVWLETVWKKQTYDWATKTWEYDYMEYLGESR